MRAGSVTRRRVEASCPPQHLRLPPHRSHPTTTAHASVDFAAMTKHLWAVPVFAQLVLASQGSFSVLDDLLAFPQVS